VLPDELEHEEFVEVDVEQGAYDRVETPVVIMRAFCEIDDQGSASSSVEM
jgi:hypothetical protein